MKKWTWIALLLAAMAVPAWAQTNGGDQEDPPHDGGATQIDSPLASDPARSWQDATRDRSRSTGSDSQASTRRAAPANGNAPGGTVTLPNCRDRDAANYGSLGNCIYLPDPPTPPPSGCSGTPRERLRWVTDRTASCPPGQTGSIRYQHEERAEQVCNTSTGSWGPGYTSYEDTGNTRVDNTCSGVTTCQDSSATNYGGPLPCQYTCAGSSSETRWVAGSCPSGQSGSIEIEEVHTRTCNGSTWSGYGPWTPTGNTRNSTCEAVCTRADADNYGQPGQCVWSCQDPSATNYGTTSTTGPVTCVYAPICQTNPGSPECCASNPSHFSCREACDQAIACWRMGSFQLEAARLMECPVGSKPKPGYGPNVSTRTDADCNRIPAYCEPCQAGTTCCGGDITQSSCTGINDDMQCDSDRRWRCVSTSNPTPPWRNCF